MGILCQLGFVAVWSSQSGGTNLAQDNPITGVDAYTPLEPGIHTIGTADLKEALVKGIADFNAMPTHYVFLGLIYPIVTLIIARIYAGYDVLPLVFPALAGFTLVGPLVAVGMYELSRRREAGLDVSRWDAFAVFRSRSIGAIAVLGLLLMIIYFSWLAVAWAIFEESTGGVIPESIGAFVDLVFTTTAGQKLILVGCTVGLCFAVVVFALSVVAFPMLLDRKVKVTVAIYTSIRAVLGNPVTMGIWGLIVAVALLIGSLPFFVGLAVVMPILGHATWHLYRKVVEH